MDTDVNDHAPTGLIIGVVLSLLVVAAAVIGFVIRRKTRIGFLSANPSESFFNSSNNLLSS
ncbi:hypothetical protein DPEC_G00093500 [Dallia pectoralis]|uniref:Uncharacterized protein n=1 Tax=Dallia pectoralis TaxID=75939 RepID=A0ACC2H166_DALPE|nr:hypothetical protein DPEC_G00093500 [Dallia pectoralis]